MFRDYLLVCVLVLAIILAYAAVCLFLVFVQGGNEAQDLSDEKEIHRERFRYGAILVFGIMTIVCLSIAYKTLQHLILEAPEALKDFGVWYLLGFLSRLPLLYHKDLIFHPSFDTDWEEVFKTFFIALLGPLQIVVTIWGIWKHKPWY